MKKNNSIISWISIKVSLFENFKATLIPLVHHFHFAKCVQTRSFFWSVFSRIRTEYGPEKIPYLDTFHAVFSFQCHFLSVRYQSNSQRITTMILCNKKTILNVKTVFYFKVKPSPKQIYKTNSKNQKKYFYMLFTFQ